MQGYLTRSSRSRRQEDAERLGAAARVSMNCWRFDSRIFDACRAVTPSARGELELPAAVGLAVEPGRAVQGDARRGPVLDLSQRADAPDVARRLSRNVTPRP